MSSQRGVSHRIFVTGVAAVLWLAMPVAANPTAVRPEYTKRVDIPLCGSAAAALIIAASLSANVQSVPAEGLDPAEIGLTVDRNSVGQLDTDLNSASNVVRNATIALPLVLSAISAPGARWQAPARALLFAESLALTDGVTAVMKNVVSRPRPYTYVSDAERPTDAAYDVSKDRAFQSMPSGHATTAWCAAGFSMTDHLLTRPRASWEEQAVVGLAAGALASTASLLRVEAGQHFPTDVVAGSAIGAAGGIVVPLLHRYTSSEGRAPMPSKKSWLASAAGAVVGTGLVIAVDEWADSH